MHGYICLHMSTGLQCFLGDKCEPNITEEYLREANEFIRSKCGETAVSFIYLPAPPQARSRHPAYLDQLEKLTRYLHPPPPPAHRHYMKCPLLEGQNVEIFQSFYVLWAAAPITYGASFGVVLPTYNKDAAVHSMELGKSDGYPGPLPGLTV